MSDFKSNHEELQQELVRLKSELKASKNHKSVIQDNDVSFRLFYENSSDALLITSPDGGIHAVNPAGCKLFGWSEEEICKGGRNLLVDLTDKTLPLALKKREEEGYVEGELIFKKKDGAKFVGEYTSKIFNNSEGLLRTSMIVRDVTDRKKAEKLIDDREKELIKLNATKDRLFSIVAHDLRGPFNNLKSLATLINKKLEQNDIEKAQEFAGLIFSSADKSLALLENLLKWAKSQSGEMRFTPGKIILSEVIVDVIELLSPLLTTKNITISYNPSNDLIIYADENMFRLVVRNLLSNAIKFTNPGGTIEVSASSKEDYVEISICDNGVGMNDKKLKDLFDISTNTIAAGTAGEQGSGLGLIISKEFVERNRGEMWAISEEGNGSDFRFTIPVYNQN